MNKSNSFLLGSIILICANVFSKIMGAIFKIPLAYILKEEGMAVYNTAFSVYITVLSLVPGAFAFAGTKILSDLNAKRKENQLLSGVKTITLIMAVMSCVAVFFMNFLSPWLSYAMKEPQAVVAIKQVSWAVIFVAISSGIKSFNEARGNLIPTAVSQVGEAFVKLFLGLYFAKIFIKQSIFAAAGGALMAVAVGEAFQSLILYIFFLFNKRHLKKEKQDRYFIKNLMYLVVPLTLTGCISSGLQMVEVSAIRTSLSHISFDEQSAFGFLEKIGPYTDVFDNLVITKSFSLEQVRKLYGAFSGYAQTIFNLPIGIISSLLAAATPMIVSNLHTKNKEKIHKSINKILVPTLFLSYPCMAVFIFFSKEVLKFIFSNALASYMLAYLAPSMVFICVSNVLMATLHLNANIAMPFFASFIAALVKVVLSMVFIKIPILNINGAPLAFFVSYFLMYILLKHQTKRILGVRIGIFKQSAVFIASSCVMVGGMLLIKPVLYLFFGEKLAFLMMSGFGALVYFLAVLLWRKNIKELFSFKQ